MVWAAALAMPKARKRMQIAICADKCPAAVAIPLARLCPFRTGIKTYLNYVLNWNLEACQQGDAGYWVDWITWLLTAIVPGL